MAGKHVRADEAEAPIAVDLPTLAKRFHGRIRMLATRRLRDPSAAEDVAQETLARVVDATKRGRLENPQALAAFVYQTARHICLQRGRKAERRERALWRFRREEATRPRQEGVLTALIGAERAAAVQRALERLDEGDRQLLRMLYYEDLQAKEVAVRMQVTPGAMRVRKHRALQRLGVLLSGEDG